MKEEVQCIWLEDAARSLGVTRATVYYYMEALGIKKIKFPLDKRAYLATSDFERIKSLKEKAVQRGQAAKEDTEPRMKAIDKDAA